MQTVTKRAGGVKQVFAMLRLASNEECADLLGLLYDKTKIIARKIVVGEGGCFTYCQHRVEFGFSFCFEEIFYKKMVSLSCSYRCTKRIQILQL